MYYTVKNAWSDNYGAPVLCPALKQHRNSTDGHENKRYMYHCVLAAKRYVVLFRILLSRFCHEPYVLFSAMLNSRHDIVIDKKVLLDTHNPWPRHLASI